MEKLKTSQMLRGVEIFLGIVFFVSGYSKLIEINKFTVQIYSYGIIGEKSILPWIALGVVLLELSLAVMLTFGIKYRKTLHTFVFLLLIFFSGLILYGWLFHNLQDCGCFGKIEMGPGPSLGKNFILIALTLICLTGVKKMGTSNTNFYFTNLKLVVLLIVLISAFFMGYSKLKIETSAQSKQNLSPFDSLLHMKFEIDGKTYDFSKGEYLIALLSFGCEHCIEEASKLNNYLLIESFPSLIALCLEETSEEREDFISKVKPEFPIYSLGNKPLFFLSLIDKEPPRLIHIRDGKVLKIWDYNLPEINELGSYFDSINKS